MWNWMRKAAFLLLCLVMLVGNGPAAPCSETGTVPAGAKEKTGSPTPRPAIRVDKLHVDLGEVSEDGALLHDFLVRNEGDAPLHIQDVRPG